MKFKDLKEGQDYWIRLYNVKQFDEGRFTIAGNSFGDNNWFGSEKTVTAVSTEDCVLIEKDKIPQCVADWVEINKERGSFEMLLDPYSYDDALEILDWYDGFNNDNLANEILAKAYLFGYEVKERLGVLLVDIPENGYCKYNYLYKGESGKFSVDFTDETDIFVEYAHKVTEAEAKEKYPQFKWVSLEELENE